MLHEESWKYSWGPSLNNGGCLFRLWARPGVDVELILESDSGRCSVPMIADADGFYRTRVEGLGEGALYWFKIDGAGPYPDPASRYQPKGVHGPSQIIDASRFQWQDHGFQAPALRDLVIYELHVGTYTPAGTFGGLMEKLDNLRQLGINLLELMPIADFAGEWNWGYDGVSPYAPAHSYGTPDDLRYLIQAAHLRGIAVCLDVVYNHLGPDGAYHSIFAPQFFTKKHKTPWGDGPNYDSEGREKVRDYFIESAIAWVRDYHIDALRADATDTIHDESQLHFLTELSERVHQAAASCGRRVFLIAEDSRNERGLILPASQGGNGFDAVWSDDFHHAVHRRLTGDRDGYYRDFDGSTESIATIVKNGWLYCGKFSEHYGYCRGTNPKGLSYESRIFCIQNHDQVGNRAFGERLTSLIPYPAFCAASALLLLSPEVPLLFMGQEWAAPEPFLYFTDHGEELGRLVTEGRRKEFAHFSAFADEMNQERIPDPQNEETFCRSHLNWERREEPTHAGCLEWYRTLLQIRKELLANAEFHQCQAYNEQTLSIVWTSSDRKRTLVVALEGPATAQVADWRGSKLVLSSEDSRFMRESRPVDWRPDIGEIRLERAGAVVLESGDWTEITKEPHR